MLRFKSCPRCKGDVILDQDQYGWYEYCLQCGYIGDLVHIEELAQEQASDTKEDRKAGPKHLSR